MLLLPTHENMHCIEMRLNVYTQVGVGVRTQSHFSTNAFMHEQAMISFAVCIWGMKYLNECTCTAPSGVS